MRFHVIFMLISLAAFGSAKNGINYFNGKLLKESKLHFYSQNKDLCGHIVPGLQRMTRGVDITKLDLLHDYKADNNDGFVGANYVELTCKKKRKLSINEIEYDVPDQVLSIDILPRDQMATRFDLIRSLSDAKEQLKSVVGLADIDITKGSFSLSSQYQHYQEVLMNSTKMMSTFQAVSGAFEINLAPRTSLRKSQSEFMSDFIVEELPLKYEENPDKYREFINNYGTHYFRSAVFGGIFDFKSLIEPSLAVKWSEKEMTRNIRNYYRSLLSRRGVPANGARFDLSKKSAKLLRDKIETSQNFYGGDAFLLEIDRYENWLPTIGRNPWLIGGQLAPMTDLIKNETVKNELEKAVDIHMMVGYLKECQRILYAQKRKESKSDSENSSGNSEIEKIIELVEDFLCCQTHDIASIQKILRQIEAVKLQVKIFQV